MGYLQGSGEFTLMSIENEENYTSRMAKVTNRMAFAGDAHANAKDPFEGGQLYERDRIIKMLEKLIDERSGVNLQGAIALIKEMKI